MGTPKSAKNESNHIPYMCRPAVEHRRIFHQVGQVEPPRHSPTAIKSVSALEAVLIPVIEPIANPVWVFLMLGEPPGKWAIAGGLIVLAAVTLRCAVSAGRDFKKGSRVGSEEAESF
ncbi:MAG TPA: DMT family transporter [Thermoanaerobacterales bacterium]|nr:DMT family transporter [Thermoanaerobacterales bacterium]